MIEARLKVADGFRTEILAGKHQLVADEPADVGGTNEGPSPYDLLLSALGACTVMTIKMYVGMKKWEVEEIIIRLDHEKDYAKDCADCEKESAKIDHIYRSIEVKGNLDEKQRERILMIANKCPVHKTMHSEIEVHTDLI